jgi:hypothetical protein
VIKRLQDMMRKPSARTLAQLELEEAQRERLESLTKLDYYRQIVLFQDARVNRLRAYLETEQ